jgi:hypothetical protein
LRRYFIWEALEISFRYQLRDLDELILRCRGVWNKSMAMQRNALWIECWGGGVQGFVPGLNHSHIFSDETVRDRRKFFPAMQDLVREWPECPPAILESLNALNGSEYLQVEHQLWCFYAQTYFDYYRRLPSLPSSKLPCPLYSVEEDGEGPDSGEYEDWEEGRPFHY